MKIPKISCPRPRSVDKVELGDFILLFCKRQQGNVKEFKTPVHFCSLNLLFDDVLGSVLMYCSQEPIQYTKQYTTANQWPLNKRKNNGNFLVNRYTRTEPHSRSRRGVGLLKLPKDVKWPNCTYFRKREPQWLIFCIFFWSHKRCRMFNLSKFLIP